MTVRSAVPTDLGSLSTLFGMARAEPARSLVASALPTPYALEGVGDTLGLLRASLGLYAHARLFVEVRGALRAAALVYVSARPEWIVLVLVARPDPQGADAAFRLLDSISAWAAEAGALRLYASAPDAPLARETFFQAGFYSFTTQRWFLASRPLGDGATRAARAATTRDAHDLFRLYARTTPHAVQRAEQLSLPDFDMDRAEGGLGPPYLVGGNPLAMRRGAVLAVGDETGLRGALATFHGRASHPDVCKVRAAEGDVDLARDLLRMGVASLGQHRPIASPVRSYEEHVARALEAEGFQASGAAMLFAKELAVRVEERAFAPAVVR